jgi:hypothetical protein
VGIRKSVLSDLADCGVTNLDPRSLAAFFKLMDVIDLQNKELITLTVYRVLKTTEL